jgi:hypothetical protein
MKYTLATLFMLLAACLSAQELPKAAVKGSVRLFADKDDVTSVILLIPDGSEVEIISSDTAYTLVRYSEAEGYVSTKKLGPAQPVFSAGPAAAVAGESMQPVQQPAEYQPANRYEALVMKYGEDIGKRLYQQKVWKGITADMAIDSWGSPKQINRMYVDQNTDEEWIYSKKWLYFRNGILIEWGPVK